MHAHAGARASAARCGGTVHVQWVVWCNFSLLAAIGKWSHGQLGSAMAISFGIMLNRYCVAGHG